MRAISANFGGSVYEGLRLLRNHIHDTNGTGEGIPARLHVLATVAGPLHRRAARIPPAVTPPTSRIPIGDAS